MARKIFAWILIVLGGLFLLVSVAGIAATWIYNAPLKHEATAKLTEVDGQLAQVQTTLENAQMELDRALRIVDAAQTSLAALAKQSTDAKSIIDNVKGALNDQLLPGLQSSRDKLNAARTTLENLRTALQKLSSLVDLSLPDQMLTDLIGSADSLDSEIARVQSVAQQASTFVSDTSYLLGGDLSETRDHLQSMLTMTKEYDGKIIDWRKQIAMWKANAPRWIDEASIGLTIFLLWFGISQFGLILHGLALRRGENPLAVLHRKG